jgi:hypothetical protein
VTTKNGNQPFNQPALSPVEGFKEPALSPNVGSIASRSCPERSRRVQIAFRVCEFLVPAHSFFRKRLIQLTCDDFHVSGIPETWMLRGITAKKTPHCRRGPNSTNSLANSRSTSVYGIMRSSLCSTRPIAESASNGLCGALSPLRAAKR